MIIIDTGAIRRRHTCSFEPSACGAPEERAKERRLIGIRRLMAEPAAEVALLRKRVVGLDIVADRVFAEWRILRKVVGSPACNIGSRREVRLGASCKAVQLL